MSEKILMQGVVEYNEGLDVFIGQRDGGRVVIMASNDGGFNGGEIDVLDLIAWLKQNRRDLL